MGRVPEETEETEETNKRTKEQTEQKTFFVAFMGLSLSVWYIVLVYVFWFILGQKKAGF